ncbi:MAG: D-serine ammonia-lyase [Deltaproteobacteria bacterium]|jgi:D-serine dehydratase|nr:D-serine ammonia-lyase [Deltaproteobacteria bacterium]
MGEIAGLDIEEWKRRLPLLAKVMAGREVFWGNPFHSRLGGRRISPTLGLDDILGAEGRLERFAPYLAHAFPETRASHGLVESDLCPVPKMKAALDRLYGTPLPGFLYAKLDSYLPIAGSVKARGGVYEVLCLAENIAQREGALTEGDDYATLATKPFKRLFSRYRILVGSTGNLGLSIGITGTRLGFEVIVHMSSDAKPWKKELLRANGATVIEHPGDYGEAVAAGRREAAGDPKSHFVDDENSRALFLGYSVAAVRLKTQLRHIGLLPNAHRPLFVYLPCGVGGAPGGITFGLRTLFGDDAHCFFAEPTQAPAMLLGLMTDKRDAVSAADFGLAGQTEADGLAVARPSGFVAETLRRDISGVFTVTDDRLLNLLRLLADKEGLWFEPSALAGFPGPWKLLTTEAGQIYLEANGLKGKLKDAIHVVWGTGGGMVPPATMKALYRKTGRR